MKLPALEGIEVNTKPTSNSNVELANAHKILYEDFVEMEERILQNT